MLCLSTGLLPEGEGWEYELKLDGYRAVAIKTGRTVQLRSRNDKGFAARLSFIVMGLAALPTDGGLVPFEDSVRPSFSALQTMVGLIGFSYGLSQNGFPAREQSERRSYRNADPAATCLAVIHSPARSDSDPGPAKPTKNKIAFRIFTKKNTPKVH